MESNKKLLTLSLAAILSLSAIPSNLYAIDLTDAFDGSYSNATSAGTWKDPVNGSNYFYGGSYEFRFKKQNSAKPLLTYQLPQYKAGCQGMSIKGGFIQMLGLSDIQEQLSSAGDTLVWGVVMGIVYSLPGVKDVFTTVQQWVRMIQTLLQNACHFGALIGQNMVDKLAPDLKKDVENTEKQVTGYINEKLGYADMKGYLDSPDKAVAAIDSQIDKAFGNKGNQNTLVSAQTSKTGQIAAAFVGKGGVAQTVSNAAGEVKKVGIHTGTLSDLINIGSVGDVPVTLNSDATLNIYMLLSFFGDLALTPAGEKGINQLLGSDKTVDKDALKAVMKAEQAGNAQNQGGEYTLTNPVIADATDAAKALMYGFSKAKDCGYSDTCMIPDRNLYIAVKADNMPAGSIDLAGSDMGAGVTLSYTNFVMLGSENPSSTLPFTWLGLFNESQKAVQALVQRQLTGNTGGVNLDDIKAPLLLPGAMKYITLIANEARRQNMTTVAGNAYITHLITMVAKYNSYFAAQSLIEMTKSRVLSMVKQSTASSGTSTQSYKLLLDSIDKRAEEINNAILAEHYNDISYNDLIAMFEKLEATQKQNRDAFAPRKQ